MSTTDALCNQRNSFRCPVTESRRRCELRIGAELLPARLVDESAGGFAVLVDRRPDLEIGQTVQLRTDSGWFDVQVRSAAEAPSPEEASDCFRLGLQRLGEAAPSEEPTASPFTFELRNRLRQWSPPNGWMSLSGVWLALAAIIVPLGLMGGLWYASRSEVGAAVSWRDPWTSSSEGESSGGRTLTEPLPASGFGGGFQTASPSDDHRDFAFGNVARSLLGSSANRTGEPDVFGPDAERNLRDLVRRLPGPTTLVLPEVVRRLRLTEKQQKLIRQLVDSMVEAHRRLDLDPLLRGAERREITRRRTELLDEYLRRALDVLTPEQRAEWKKIHDAPAKK